MQHGRNNYVVDTGENLMLKAKFVTKLIVLGLGFALTLLRNLSYLLPNRKASGGT